jgi:hypothetical protein
MTARINRESKETREKQINININKWRMKEKMKENDTPVVLNSDNFFNWYSGGWSPNWVYSALRPPIGLLCQPRVIMMEKLVEWWLAGETEVLGENLPQWRFVHHKLHMPAWTRTPAAAVGSQRLTAWATARPKFWQNHMSQKFQHTKGLEPIKHDQNFALARVSDFKSNSYGLPLDGETTGS